MFIAFERRLCHAFEEADQPFQIRTKGLISYQTGIDGFTYLVSLHKIDLSSVALKNKSVEHQHQFELLVKRFYLFF